jgi:hypothetical protein
MEQSIQGRRVVSLLSIVRSLRSLWGVECATCADGMALPVTLSVRCAVALPPSGCFFDQGVTTFWRRGVARQSFLGR